MRTANACAGFGGADMKALCTEAALRALRRTYPQVYTQNTRLKIDKSKIFVTEVDLDEAMASVQCSSRRSRPSLGMALPTAASPCLIKHLAGVASRVATFFPAAKPALKRIEQSLRGEADAAIPTGPDLERALVTSYHGMDTVYRPRVMLYGRTGDAHNLVARALIQGLDPIPCYGLDMSSLHMHTGTGGKVLEEAVVSVVAEARARSPSILFLPDFHTWWASASDSLRNCLESSIKNLPSALPVLLLVTSDLEAGADVPLLKCRHVVAKHHCVRIPGPSSAEVTSLFAPLLRDVTTWTDHPSAAPPPPELEKDETEAQWAQVTVVDPIQKEREEKAIRGMRMNLRKVCMKLLSNKSFKHFHLPVLETDVAPSVKDAYRRIIAKPMDLATILQLVDSRVIKCKSQFVERIELIVQNAMTFNGPDGPDAQQLDAKASDSASDFQIGGVHGRPYVVPSDQEHVIKAGAILECHLEDPVTRELEWFPCKVTSVDEERKNFEVHIVIENSRERGGWTDTYPFDDEGSNWRWPNAQAAIRSQDAAHRYKIEKDSNAAMVRSINDQICSLAHELRDEVEDLFEKLDSWLVGECDRIVAKLGADAEDPNIFGSSIVKTHAASLIKDATAVQAVPKQNNKTLTRVPVYACGTGINAAVRRDGVLLQLQQGLHVVCNGEVMTLHQFEKAAGNTSRRPRESICISDTGHSLAFAMQEYKLAKVPNERTAMCASCDKDDNPTLVLFCTNFDKCGGVWHTYCLKPALKNVPEGDWFCPGCPLRAKSHQVHFLQHFPVFSLESKSHQSHLPPHSPVPSLESACALAPVADRCP